jgi:hypothetical protein
MCILLHYYYLLIIINVFLSLFLSAICNQMKIILSCPQMGVENEAQKLKSSSPPCGALI